MADTGATKPRFISRVFDEFENKTTTVHIEKLIYAELSGEIPLEFQLREIKSKDGNWLILACDTENICWITFNCDQENYKAYYDENSDCPEIGIELSQEILRNICDSRTFKMRITAGNSHEPDATWCAEFQKYCRQFYNNVFDRSLYSDAITDPIKDPTKIKPSVAASPKSGHCFIATAVMGSYDDPSVQVLRIFRDEVLMRSLAGRRFIDWYYRFSPPIAMAIRGREWICVTAKWFLVLPASRAAMLLLQLTKQKTKIAP